MEKIIAQCSHLFLMGLSLCPQLIQNRSCLLHLCPANTTTRITRTRTTEVSIDLPSQGHSLQTRRLQTVRHVVPRAASIARGRGVLPLALQVERDRDAVSVALGIEFGRREDLVHEPARKTGSTKFFLKMCVRDQKRCCAIICERAQ